MNKIEIARILVEAVAPSGFPFKVGETVYSYNGKTGKIEDIQRGSIKINNEWFDNIDAYRNKPWSKADIEDFEAIRDNKPIKNRFKVGDIAYSASGKKVTVDDVENMSIKIGGAWEDNIQAWKTRPWTKAEIYFYNKRKS